MTMHNRKFVVVEMAGMAHGEQDVASFDNWRDASRYMDETYSPEERDQFHRDCLHVDIRQDWTDESGEEHSEYVY